MWERLSLLCSQIWGLTIQEVILAVFPDFNFLSCLPRDFEAFTVSLSLLSSSSKLERLLWSCGISPRPKCFNFFCTSRESDFIWRRSSRLTVGLADLAWPSFFFTFSDPEGSWWTDWSCATVWCGGPTEAAQRFDASSPLVSFCLGELVVGVVPSVKFKFRVLSLRL